MRSLPVLLLLSVQCSPPADKAGRDASGGDSAPSVDTEDSGDSAADSGTGDGMSACTEHDDCDPASSVWCLSGTCTWAPDYSPGLSYDDVADEWSAPDGPGYNADPTEIGAAIDSFCGVTAYQNGSDIERGISGTYGYEFQCTELAFRFLCTTTGWCTSYDREEDGYYGNAAQWYSASGNTWVNQLDRHPNGGSEPPRSGDILVFSGGEYGHVAVVKSVDLGAGVVSVLEQNCYNCAHAHTLTTSGGYSISGAVGWMRATGTAAERCEASCTGDLRSVSISGTRLTVTGSVSCAPAIDRWSLVVGSTTVYTEEPGTPSDSFSVTVDLATTGAPDGTQALGLWALGVDAPSADRLDDDTITWDDSGTGETCTNGGDDDGDGLTDCSDEDCVGDSACSPRIDGISCSDMDRGAAATCTVTGANFMDGGAFWIGCLDGISYTVTSASRIDARGTWSCGCALEAQEAAYRHPGTSSAATCEDTTLKACATLPGPLQLGRTVLDRVDPAEGRAGTDVAVQFQGCNLCSESGSTSIWIEDIPLSGATCSVTGDTVSTTASVGSSTSGTKECAVARAADRACGDEEKDCITACFVAR